MRSGLVALLVTSWGALGLWACSGEADGDAVGDAVDAGGDANLDGGSASGGSASGGAATGGAASSGGASSGGASSGGSGSGSGGAASGGAASGGQSSGGTNGTGGTSPAEPEVPDNAACAAVSDWPSARSEEEEQVLALVNQRRASGASCGGTAMPAVAPLTMDPYLRCAARLHSLDMAQRDYFSHATWNESATTCQADNGCTSGNICGSEFPDDPDDDVTPIKRCGKSPGTRVSEAGGPSGAGWENIAAGNDTAEATMTQWMNSSGHCTNIMRANLKTIGIGFATGPATYGDYWTQSFND